MMICCLLLAGSSNSELVVHEEEIEPTIGDFFQFEMVGNSFPDFIGKSVDEEKYLRVEDYDGNGFRFEITGKGETAFDNETVNYIVMMMTWETEFTLYFDDLMDDGDGKLDVIIDFPIPLLVMGGCRIGMKVSAGSNYAARVEISYTVLNSSPTTASFDKLKNKYIKKNKGNTQRLHTRCI